jgi:hypothetical protein
MSLLYTLGINVLGFSVTKPGLCTFTCVITTLGHYPGMGVALLSNRSQSELSTHRHIVATDRDIQGIPSRPSPTTVLYCRNDDDSDLNVYKRQLPCRRGPGGLGGAKNLKMKNETDASGPGLRTTTTWCTAHMTARFLRPAGGSPVNPFLCGYYTALGKVNPTDPCERSYHDCSFISALPPSRSIARRWEIIGLKLMKPREGVRRVTSWSTGR